MTRDEMKNIFGILIDMYPTHRDTPPEKITTLINFWHSEFKHIDNDTFGNAVRQVIRSSKFFPTIAEVFEVLNEADETILDIDAEFQHAIMIIKSNPIRTLYYTCPDTGDFKAHTTTIDDVLGIMSPSIAKAVRSVGISRMMNLDDRVWVKKEFKEILNDARNDQIKAGIKNGIGTRNSGGIAHEQGNISRIE